MSQKQTISDASFIGAIRSDPVEDAILTSAGIKTLDAVTQPTTDPQVGPIVVTTRPEPSATPLKRKELAKSDADAEEPKLPEEASDILVPFIGTRLTFVSRRKTSGYIPSALMMDYVLHNVNLVLVDNYYFKRLCPDYHPYVLRLYYGTLFIIQTLRAMQASSTLSAYEDFFLTRFLREHPPTSLPIAGPMNQFFLSLSAFRPEIETYGPVAPRIDVFGPATRSDFTAPLTGWGLYPNVPGIFALLEHLNSLINGVEPIYPSKGRHTPVTADAVEVVNFGHHAFPPLLDRTVDECWALVSSGLNYPCEADEHLNEAFAERYSNFDFPVTDAADNIQNSSTYLGMDGGLSWFNQVKNVAAASAMFFQNSCTLANCEPFVCSANQAIIEYQTPATIPVIPRHNADPRARFPLSFRMVSSARSFPPMYEAIAASAQTHVSIFNQHPRFGDFDAQSHVGDFWEIRPTESSRVDLSTYLEIPHAIKRMMKDRI